MCAGVVRLFEKCAPVVAVRGNVDDTEEDTILSDWKRLELKGWRIIVTHIVEKKASQVGQWSSKIFDHFLLQLITSNDSISVYDDLSCFLPGMDGHLRPGEA
jgi:hypothetical protein